MMAYTAPMHLSYPKSKQYICSCLIIVSAFLTAGCCTPGNYHDQGVTYVPQNPYYVPAYSYQSYPVYQPVVIPIPAPRSSWSSCPPPPCHPRSDWSGYQPNERWSCTGGAREGYHAPLWQQRPKNDDRPMPDRNPSTQPQQDRQQAAVAAIQQSPSLKINQCLTDR